VDVSKHNRAIYRSALRAREYRAATELHPAEMSILSRLGSEFTNKRILDIGVGGGRTTSHLLEISNHYIGIDYSPRMIAQCRRRYPSVSFDVCDARDLSQFGTEAFDLIFFSFNGIDSVDHQGRLQALGEIGRVLKKDGTFIFSTHNRLSIGTRPSQDLTPRMSLFAFFRKVLANPHGMFYRAVNVRHEEANDQYAIVNDDASNYRLLNYYISPDKQLEQLKAAGFHRVDMVGIDGRWIPTNDYSGCRSDIWIHYVCRR
jgi:SAM-dependent methyltransferase